MRVLLLNYEFPPLGGGAGNATYYLLRELSKNSDLEIDLITSSVDKYRTELFSQNINIHFLDIGKKDNLQYQSEADLIKYSWKAFNLSKKLKKQKRYSLVHAFFGIPCGYVAQLLKLPYIVSLRGSDVPFYNPRFKILDTFIFQRLSRMVWEKASAVITNSQGLKQLAQETSPELEFQVIYNGVDANEFKPRKSSTTFNILSTSRLIERKGIKYLIEGFGQFYKKHQAGKLLLVGSGNLENELKNLAHKIGLGSVVEFRGTIPHEKTIQLYQSADIFALPSLNEGMSNSVLEAMSSGLPIIATDTGGTNELIDKSNGFIIKKSNSHEIFQALEKIYQDQSQRIRMGQSSRQKAETMSWKNMADQYLNLYKKNAQLA